ncbi:MAG: thioredoxin family protein [Flavisolibacter sp.]
MKRLLTFSIFLLFAFAVSAQETQVTTESDGTKIIKGFFTKKDIVTDSSFAWYAVNLQGYTPDQNALQALRANKDSINIITFGGTWCSDTKNILPKLFALTDAAGFSQDRVTHIGVDRNKKTIYHLAEAFNVINVPTIIVMKNGKEIGRVVEYGKYGMFDKELGEIIGKK